MILLRGQKLGDDDLLAFSRRFGALDPPPNQERGRISPPGYPDIYVVSNVLDGKGDPIGALGAGEAVWHTDMSYLDTPPDASMLYSLEIPSTGGNTWFCGMQAACDALPADLLGKIKGRRIKHDGTYNSGGYLRKGVTPTDDPMAAPGAWHPAILRHPANGRATLYLGRRRNSYVEGYSRAESDAVLEALWSTRHAAALRLRACLEAGRPRDVGQPLDHASPRSVRRRGAPHHASHPDQGQPQACGLRGLNKEEQPEGTCGGRRSSMPGAMPTRI